MTEFIQLFNEYKKESALIWKHQEYSYQYILDRISFWKTRLNYLENGSIVGIESDFTPETIAILFVLIERRLIIVPLDIKNSDKNEKKRAIAQIDYLIQVDSDSDIKIQTVENTEQKNELFTKLLANNEPGLVLFTSGSSGEPKGAVHNFSKLLSKFFTKRKALRTINFLLFDHWGGLNTLFHILSNGGTVLALENRAPDHVCSLIEKYRVELLPTSPTFLNMLVLSRAYERYSLDSLKIISYGAEPMPESLLKHLNKLFPHVKLQQTYGLIELGVMRSKSEENNSLWVKLGGDGYETRVVENMLQIKSDSAMLGYLNASSPFTEDGWFKTGDSVELKGEYFKILGRNSEIINVGGEKVFPQEVENVILKVDGIADVLVYSENNRLTGKIVCAKVKYIGDANHLDIIRSIKTQCRKELETFKVPVKIIFADNSFESGRFKKIR